MRFIVVHETEKNVFKPIAWDEEIDHLSYVASLAGMQSPITEETHEGKEPFIELLSRVSSFGIVEKSPSRGWHITSIEMNSTYKNRMEQDTSLMIRHLQDIDFKKEAAHQISPSALAAKINTGRG